MGFKATVRRNEFARIATELAPNVDEVVEATARNIEREARTRSIPRLKRAWSTRTANEGHFRAVAGIFDRRKWFWASFVEFGTRYQGARPMLTPAAEAERPKFLAAMRKVFGDGR